MADRLEVKELDQVVVRFSGDSGDGMQLAGNIFSTVSATVGNDICTFPDYPADIRAPQGSLTGVSGFQVHIGEEHITTPGDYADVLVAMNPAALKANLRWAKKAGTIIVDIDAFTDKHIERAGYTANPLEDGSLADYNVVPVKVTELTIEALKETGLDQKSILRCKNMFALGMIYWMFEQSVEHTEAFFDIKFGKKPAIASANKMVLRAGYNYAANVHALATHFKVRLPVIRPQPGDCWQLQKKQDYLYSVVLIRSLRLPIFCMNWHFVVIWVLRLIRLRMKSVVSVPLSVPAMPVILPVRRLQVPDWH